MGSYAYLPLERVVFGQPAAQAAAEEAARIGARRVFVVASKSLSRKTSAIKDIAQALGSSYAGLFDECVAHTPWPSVIAAADAVRAAAPDLILTVGGGTPIDTVKILQLVLAHGARVAEDLERLRAPQLKESRPSPVRQVAIPTTLSGAEFSNLGGGTDPRTRIKHSFMGADIGARAVILDPAITLHTPEWLWLSTGIRGVDHAVEALCSVDAHPYCDGLALHALRLFAEGLPRTKAAPRDLAARLLCQQASWLAASTIARVNYGASHGSGHALGATADVPHGRGLRLLQLRRAQALKFLGLAYPVREHELHDFDGVDRRAAAHREDQVGMRGAHRVRRRDHARPGRVRDTFVEEPGVA